MLLLTHLIDDRPMLVEALHRVAPIAALIGIEYSSVPAIATELARSHQVFTPALEELRNPASVVEIALAAIDPSRPVVICEIGGYFAPALDSLHERLGSRLVGVVEDTESGHRAYERVADRGQLPCPVYSLARSPLKRPEDALIGRSCVFSVDRILRAAGMLLDTREALVLGYGKVGRGAALALRSRHCHVSVFDIDPARRSLALAEGFAIPPLERAIRRAQLVLGATGARSLDAAGLAICRPGAVLASCSSRDVEFELETLRRDFRVISESDDVTTFEKNGRALHLLYDGRPVNFRDGAVVGPFLALIQGEMLMALAEVVADRGRPGLRTVSGAARQFVASRWLHTFCDTESGFLRTAWDERDG